MSTHTHTYSLDDVKKRILARVSLSALVGEHSPLQSRSGRPVALCPFHDEKTPSFNIYDDSNYYCFGCKASGDAITYVRQRQGLGFVETLKYLAGKYGVDAPELQDSDARLRKRDDVHTLGRALLAAQDFFVAELHSERGAKARAYLAGRGFSDESIRDFGFGLTPDQGWGLVNHLQSKGFTENQIKEASLGSISERTSRLYDFFRDDRVMIPIRDSHGKLIAFGGRTLGDHPAKYINSRESVLFEKSAVLFGFDVAKVQGRQRRRIIVVEGYMDVLSLRAHGLGEAVAVMGTALSSKHLQLIRSCCGQAFLVFDGDAAGKNASMSAVENALAVPEVQIRVVELPTGEDPDTVMNSAGVDAFEERLSKSAELLDFAVQMRIRGAPSLEIPRILSKELLPWIAQISDRVQRGFLIAKVAQLSGIATGQIEQVLRSLKPVGATTQEVWRARQNAEMIGDGEKGEKPAKVLTAQPLTSLEFELLGHLFFARGEEGEWAEVRASVCKNLNLDPVWQEFMEHLLQILTSSGACPAEVERVDPGQFIGAGTHKVIDDVIGQLKERAKAFSCPGGAGERRQRLARIGREFEKERLQSVLAKMKGQLQEISRRGPGGDPEGEGNALLKEVSQLNQLLVENGRRQ